MMYVFLIIAGIILQIVGADILVKQGICFAKTTKNSMFNTAILLGISGAAGWNIVNAILCLKLDKKEQNPNLVVEQAYVQILLARSIPAFNLQEKSSVESNDIIYQTVSYIAKHFKEEMSLEKMARDMGVSKFTLSRVFSGTFHRNFNQYLNEQRLNYVCVHLECTDKSITDISMDAGFESQRTFNRVFREQNDTKRIPESVQRKVCSAK